MDYRDELAAALARIAALEQEQQSTHSQELGHLRIANDGLRSEVRRLKAQHQQALADLEEVRLGAPLQPGAMPTLRVHNEGAKGSPVVGQVAGVLCSRCAEYGLAREMKYVDETLSEAWCAVMCTSCGTLGLKRS